jgi:hypothetical protein
MTAASFSLRSRLSAVSTPAGKHNCTVSAPEMPGWCNFPAEKAASASYWHLEPCSLLRALCVLCGEIGRKLHHFCTGNAGGAIFRPRKQLQQVTGTWNLVPLLRALCVLCGEIGRQNCTVSAPEMPGVVQFPGRKSSFSNPVALGTLVPCSALSAFSAVQSGISSS